jgi:O-antigen ligase
MDSIKIVFFIFLLSGLIIQQIWGVGSSAIKGLSLRNFALYFPMILLFLMMAVEKRRIIAVTPGGVILLCFVGYAGFTAFAAGYLPGVTATSRLDMYALVKNQLIVPFLLYLLGCSVFSDKKTYLLLIKVAVVTFAVFNILGLSILFTGFNIAGFKALSHHGSRYAGFIGIANQGAYALAFLLPLIAYFLEISDSRKAKIVFLFLFFTTLASIVPTASRGCLILLPLMFGLMYFFTRSFKLILMVFLGMGVGIIVFSIISPEYVTNAVERFSLWQDAESIHKVSAGRTYFWQAAFKLLANNPLLLISGSGWGTFEANIAPYSEGFIGAAHNFYIKALVQTGIIGFFLLLSFIAIFLNKMVKYGKKNNHVFFMHLIPLLFVLFWNTMLASLEGSMWYYSIFLGLCVGFVLDESNTINESR